MTALRARGLTVAYGRTRALEDVTLEIASGTAVAVLGPNGSGKSTLFAAAVGLVEPVAGHIELTTPRVAYLPQQLAVDPMFPVTVRDTVRMGRWGDLGWVRRPDARDRRLADEALEALGIREIAGRRLSELSGGQRQRALLAQVMAQQADVLLLDEPFTGVDAPTAEVVRDLVGRWRDEGRAVLVATHDLERASSDYDLVLALNRRVIGYGRPGEVCTEAVLHETFAGRVARVGDAVVDTDHHHHGAG